MKPSDELPDLPPIFVDRCLGKGVARRLAEIDGVEQLAIDRAKSLFGADHANVQPYSGSPANLAVYLLADQSGYINGEVVTIDGGEWLQGAGQFNFLRKVSSQDWAKMAEAHKKSK